MMETKQIVSWLYDKAARAQDHSYARMLNVTAKRLRELDEKQRWIPVTERLPFAEYGESNDVLAVTELDVIRVLYFDGGNWCFQNGDCCPHKVTHWMPLPEPPKEEEHEPET